MIQRKSVFALTASCCQYSHSVKPGVWQLQDFSGPLLWMPLGPVLLCVVGERGCVSQKSIPGRGETMKQRMLSEIKAVLAFQHQMWFLCGVISSGDTWWLIGWVFSSPISCLWMGSTFIKLKRTKLKTDATCWSRCCGTNATWMLWQKPQKLKNPDCRLVAARVKNYTHLSSSIKMSVHLSSLTKGVTTWKHSELILLHLASKFLQLFQGLFVTRIFQLGIAQLVVFLSSINFLWKKREIWNRNYSGQIGSKQYDMSYSPPHNSTSL